MRTAVSQCSLPIIPGHVNQEGLDMRAHCRLVCLRLGRPLPNCVPPSRAAKHPSSSQSSASSRVGRLQRAMPCDSASVRCPSPGSLTVAGRDLMHGAAEPAGLESACWRFAGEAQRAGGRPGRGRGPSLVAAEVRPTGVFSKPDCLFLTVTLGKLFPICKMRVGTPAL